MANNNIQNQKEKNGNVVVMDQTLMPPYLVSRKVLLSDEVNNLTGYEKRDKNFLNSLKNSFAQFSFLSFLYNFIPVIRWLPRYPIKKFFVGDITAGITVAVMHLPQGMAYGILAGVSPSSGLYMAFFPTLVYFAFGTSRHISVGTLSVISLMTLKVVQTYSTPLAVIHETALNSTSTSTIAPDQILEVYTPMQVVTATAFMCGILHIIMYFLQLGTLASILSDSLINGFTTGAAIHVTVSQLKDLFGIKIPRHKGAFKIVYTVIDCFKNLQYSNINTVIISLVVIIFMVFMNEILKPRTAKLCRFPIPAELITVISATLASAFLDFNTNYNVQLVGDIPLGLPLPEMPPVKLLWLVIVDAIAISIVSYSVTISMAMIFAKKRHYEVRANQELLALGLSNLVGGLFSCVPNGTSLSRSLIQEQTGGNTQVASVISAFLILIILLWFGPYLEWLPRCVLSGIIIVALKGMYVQAAQLKRFRKEGKMESFTWIITFLAVVLIDVDIGLIFGIAFSLLALYIKGWKSHSTLLGVLAGTDIYVDLKTHKRAVQLPNIKIFRYIGAINFASCASFKKSLYEAIIVNHKTIRSASIPGYESQKLLGMRAVIIDLSCVTHMDVAGCKICTEIQKEMDLLNCELILTTANDSVYDAVKHAEFLGEGPFSVMPSVHDAVVFARSKIISNV